MIHSASTLSLAVLMTSAMLVFPVDVYMAMVAAWEFGMRIYVPK